MKESKEILSLDGLNLSVDDGEGDPIRYDIGRIAFLAIEALKLSVLAFEQIVTGERLVHSQDVGDFHYCLNSILEEENGQGSLSEPGSMSSIQDEIQGIQDLVNKARQCAKKVAETEAVGV